MIALSTLAADAGVAAKANAENATANAVAILPTVFMPFSTVHVQFRRASLSIGW
jgi:hypothetical protein